MSSLVQLFFEKLIPWANDQLNQRLIVVQPEMHQSEMPTGARLEYQKIQGKRVLVRTRDEGAQQIVRARWPEAGLHELFNPRLICVTAGTTNYRAGNYILTCHEGHFILLPPFTVNTTGNVPHLEGKNRLEGSCDLVQFNLYKNYVRCSISCSRGKKTWIDSECFITRKPVISLFHLFAEEAFNVQAKDHQLRGALLFSLFTLIGRDLKNKRYQERLPRRKSTFEGRDFAEQVRSYLQGHLPQAPTIESTAQALYMSPSQLTRRLRREMNRTFVEMTTEIRIEEAKRLLTETTWSVAAIARDLGFRSPTYFAILFAKHTGQKPTEFRRKK